MTPLCSCIAISDEERIAVLLIGSESFRTSAMNGTKRSDNEILQETFVMVLL